jgi:hypothetical protein
MITLPFGHHETVEFFFEKGQSRCAPLAFKSGSDTVQFTKKIQYYSNSQKTDAKYI